ncbi:uncharacterized protein LOC129766479 [Toxorhynchites rutilus septentrionalis]|uniref:uncharacterized protein LOC129766479 n=1 Tax=Toxorhynchites rutilus septentrionalis TaxID=329112 RepID=UPI002478CBDC|nr:uncharacterized protein LOC129766479 [Toxorhynchites rutilus septentrionalis]
MQALKEREMLQKRYLDQKYNLLITEAEASEAGGSVRSECSSPKSTARVREWMERHSEQVAETGAECDPAVLMCNRTAPINNPNINETAKVNTQRNTPSAQTRVIEENEHRQRRSQQQYNPQQLTQGINAYDQQIPLAAVHYSISPGVPGVSQQPELAAILQHRPLPIEPNNLSQVPRIVPNALQNPPITTNLQVQQNRLPVWGATQQQIAARQVVPRELPVFSGFAEDWPLFIRSYWNSTEMCGYSDAENLMRLQKCLRGNALEAVRSNLLIPSSVPQVIATLETLFGNPERLIGAMLNKIRSAPIPKQDKLETLVTFGVAVQNLVGHLKAANQCLVPHGKWPCKTTRACEVNGCTVYHHPLLHSGQQIDNTSASRSSAVVSVHQQRQSSILFRVIPVVLYGKRSRVDTFAFLDEGSSVSLIDKDLIDQLGIEGEDQPLCLQWTSNVNRHEENSKKFSVEISGKHGQQQRFWLNNIRTVRNLNLPVQTLNFEDLSSRFPYLLGLPVSSFGKAVPRLLIGLDNLRLAIPIKRREGLTNGPVAAKTRLGWTVFGNTDRGSTGDLSPHFHICECGGSLELEQMIKKNFVADSLGVSLTPVLESEEERRAKRILQTKTARQSDGPFETGLLWRYDRVEFPSSYAMAERRLKCLEKRLKSNSNLRISMEQQIAAYQIKGYAHKATDHELKNADPRRVWYLPLGLVINPKKPEKVRIIWDAAAKVNGISLNSMLLKGPDLLTSLPAVLSRFRQRRIAITGDIREMYHQIRIREEDCQSQRFLWRTDSSQPPDVYIMDVATFGSTCSPSSAQYVKNANAKDWEKAYPEAAIAIVENHYVDDYLDSRDTDEDMAQLAIEVKEVHSKAGFEIRNFLSNSSVVLARVGAMSPGSRKDLVVYKENSVERVLGIAWLPEQDIFTFTLLLPVELLSLVSGEIVPTKRRILRLVMSLFDPLGMISNFLIHGKVLFQELWRHGISWDEKIPEVTLGWWDKWAGQFPLLEQICIPRCYFPYYDVESYNTLQLHVFVDASETAFACVAYFRIIHRGQPRCSLVASKAKVAPVKSLSIPRLELQAAVIGSRLIKSVTNNHTLSVARRFIWSDSSTVLAWIKSDTRKYKQYVAVRISEILEETKIEEWRWVPTRSNVADEATKWGKGPNLEPTSRWFNGPEFLYEPENKWPQQKVDQIVTTEELRAVHVHREVVHQAVIAHTRFSKWERLLRTVAYTFYFIDKCRRLRTTENLQQLSQFDYERAEHALWRMAQVDAFPDEVVILNPQNKSSQRVEKTSKIRALSPFMDEYGVIRMQGRIELSSVAEYDTKYPIILPSNHRVTELLVEKFHRMFGHSNGESVVNKLRQKFQISKLRVLVRKVRSRCNWCKINHALPEAPKMAALPEERVTPMTRPFSHVGLDYFGPLMIRVNRSKVKRWVALFTCLTIRAVHLEPVASLSTESCKLAIRRFIARRGAPTQIFSDHGTNFKGASNELKDIHNALAESFTNANTKWNFIPPASPHMGGAWERMVRSVKSAMGVLNQSRAPSEEVFMTVLCEAESMVNSRPLTYMPLEDCNQEALTPNHFILLSSSGVKQSEKLPTKESDGLRSVWKFCQYLLDQFWRRWIREYLPTITRRTKWHDNVKPINEGCLVLIVDGAVRNRWIRGKVVNVIHGKDGIVRQADVQTANGILRRPAVKLAVLDVLQNSKAA